MVTKKYKVERKQMIMMGIVTKWYDVEATSEEHAEERIKEGDIDYYASDYDVEQTEDMEFITTEN